MNDDVLKSKLIELETKLAFQDDLLLKLNQAMAEQQKQLLKQGYHLQRLEEELKKRANPDEVNMLLKHERPPHY